MNAVQIHYRFPENVLMITG